MAIGQNRIMGADAYAVNLTGTTYQASLYVASGQRSKLFKVVVSNLSAADMYLWITDVIAFGSSASPRIVCLCPAGVCTTLDLSTGKPFINGIAFALATNQPVNGTTNPTPVSLNAAIIDADYRLE